MRKYTGYRPGEERFDGHLYRLMVRAEKKARENPRVNIPQLPSTQVQKPEPEAPTTICPARQVMNIYREFEAEKERTKQEKARRLLASKAEMVAKFSKQS